MPPEALWSDPAWEEMPAQTLRGEQILGHEHAPNTDRVFSFLGHPLGRVHFRTNNLGLRRDADTQAAKAPGVFRILVLGDSHTDGYVDNSENFTALLEANLNSHLANAGGNFEVLNAGVISYSPVQELLWYEIHGTRLEPNLVLAVFYVGNDVVELLDPRKPSIDTGGEVLPPRGLQSASEAELSDGLRLGILARYLVQAGPIAEPWRRLGLPGHLAEAGGYPIDTLAQVLHICRGCYWQGLLQAANARHNPRILEASISRAGASLIRLDGEVRSNGGRLAVALLPTRSQVEPTRERDKMLTVASLLGLSETDIAFNDKVGPAVLDQLTAAGIPVISLHAGLAAASESQASSFTTMIGT